MADRTTSGQEWTGQSVLCEADVAVVVAVYRVVSGVAELCAAGHCWTSATHSHTVLRQPIKAALLMLVEGTVLHQSVLQALRIRLQTRLLLLQCGQGSAGVALHMLA